MEISSEFKEQMEKLNDVEWRSLDRTEELGRDYGFRVTVDCLRQVYDDLKEVVENADAIRISKDMQTQITGLAKQANDYIHKIQAFVLRGNESNAPNQYQEILNGTEKLVQRSLDLLPPLIERANILRLNPTVVEEQVKEAASIIKEIQKIKEDAQKATDNIGQTIKEVRDTLGTEGALVSATDFENQAEEYKIMARKWFGGTILTIIGVIVLVIWMFNAWWPFASLSISNIGDDYTRLIQIIIFKLILLSIAYLLVYQSLRNYKINRHLFVLNRHRQLSLSVYPLMAKATSDQEQSNTIVTQAAKAIFEPGTTGYLDGEDSPNPVNLTEIINKVVDKA